MRKKSLKRKINSFLRKKQVTRKNDYRKFLKPFLEKARKNYTIANILFNISEQEELKKILFISKDLDMYEWAIIVSYYSMYMGALGALANLGFRSKSHAATITLLEYHYCRKNRLEPKHLDNLSKTCNLSEDLITKLIEIKTKREVAQYDATPNISKANAASALRDCEEFITAIEEILK